MGKLYCLVAVGVWALSAVVQAAGPEGHQFGQWPALSAVIAQEQQKNLNLDDKDFLLEIWFKPLPMSKYKSNPSFLVAKKCGETLAGYSLSYYGDGVTLVLCDHRAELVRDYDFGTRVGLKEGQWCYFAAAYNHRAGKVLLFADGKRVEEFGQVTVGDLSNNGPFNIGYWENEPSAQAHCEIRELRVWKLRQELPADIAAVIAAHHAWPDTVAESLARSADFSRWSFAVGNDDVPDQGNNGNTLCYASWNYQPAAIKPFPDRPAGVIRHVDNRHSQATDDGPGTRSQPFRTILRGARATGPGDVLHVCPGLYRETVMLRAGENGKPVTLEGEPGAIVSGAEPIRGWQPAGEGLWQVVNWTGNYYVPEDVNERDERANPTHLLFVADYPLDYVKTKVELIPGTWHVKPLLGHGPKTITICPLPGIDPAKVPVEITARDTLRTSNFNYVCGLSFVRGGVRLRGIGNVLENSTLAWEPYCLLSIYGQHHVVRNNRIFWGGNCGVAGNAYGLRFERNLLSFNDWRNYFAAWHGGAFEFIPASADNLVCHNEICYNCVSGIWYDTENQGNRIEWNDCHDNAAVGLFDEYSFGNTFQYNLVYNNTGCGISIANSSEDRVYRNTFYNNDGCGLFFRWFSPVAKNSPEAYEREKADFLSRLNVRRFQGLIPYQREKKFRDMVEEYCWRYPEGSVVAQNQIVENAIFDNWGWGGVEVNQPTRCGDGAAFTPELANSFDGNIYWNRYTSRIFTNGRYCTTDLDLAQWQQLSGQDRRSRWLNPLDHPEEMPDWFKQRFPFKKGDFRPVHQVLTELIPSVKEGAAKTVLMSRLLRSKRVEPLKFADPMLFGLSFDFQGKPCISLWSRGAALRELLVGQSGCVTFENKYMQRKRVQPAGGRLSLYVDEAPTTLLDFEGQLREDRSLLVEVPQWTEPGKPVRGRLLLENIGPDKRDFALNLDAGERWKAEPASVKRTLQAGEKAAMDFNLQPAAGIREGSFRFRVAGIVGGAQVSQARYFGVGSLVVLKHLEYIPSLDGRFLPWADLPPNGLAQNAEQVVFGRDKWRGPDDLSAKVWLGWKADKDLYFVIDVTDQTLAARRRQGPARAAGVELFVDVRPPWKQYMKEYTPGVFKMVFLPGEGESKPTWRFEGVPYGGVMQLASQPTAKGYRLEAHIHFCAQEIEDPGWVANRAVRIGALVYQADDPGGRRRKATIGVWRTAANVGEDCTSMTTFVTEP
jgi:parallel beta-helix repeat protein